MARRKDKPHLTSIQSMWDGLYGSWGDPKELRYLLMDLDSRLRRLEEAAECAADE